MILGINTACQPFSIAVICHKTGLLLQEKTFQSTHQQSENFITEIEKLGSLQNIKAIGITQGPGGYTGLRLGITTAKTIAQVLNIPLYGLSTLEALIQNPIGDSTTIVSIPATKHELNVALFLTKLGQYKRLSRDFTCTTNEFQKIIHKFKIPPTLITPPTHHIRAETLATYAKTCLDKNQEGPYLKINPIYSHLPNLGKLPKP